jgi:hypothetical protein
MSAAQEYKYTTCKAGMPEEYDSVTLNGREFAQITYVGHSYQVVPMVGSRAGQVFRTRGTHHSAFQDCVDYASLERLNDQFSLEVS